MHTPILGELPCLQAHNLLTLDQPDPKDKFSQIKKYDILTNFDATSPLNLVFFTRLYLKCTIFFEEIECIQVQYILSKRRQ